MRIVAVLAVVGSLAGGVWLEASRRLSQRAAPGPEEVVSGPVVQLECGRPETAASSRGHDLPSLGSAALLTMDRVPVRPSGSAATLAGWRMAIASDQGAGTIAGLEVPEGTCYAGDGVLAGWTPGELERAWRELTPDPAPFAADLAPGR